MRRVVRDAAWVAARLRAYAADIETGRALMPLVRRVAGLGSPVVPAPVHDLLCGVRVQSAQDTDPIVLGCAFCGLAFTARQPDEENTR